MYKCFPNSHDKIIRITPKTLSLLLRFFALDKGESFRRRNKAVTCLYSRAWVRKELLDYTNTIDIGEITKAALKLPREAVPCEIKRFDFSEKTRALMNRYSVQTGKTVLMNVVSYACGSAPINVFEEIAKGLQAEGYTVLTNAVGDRKPINGTEGISFPLDDATVLLDTFSYVVGARSGFMDLACFSNAAVVAIDNESYYAANAYLLEALWRQKNNCCTYRYTDGKTDHAKLINDVISYIKSH